MYDIGRKVYVKSLDAIGHIAERNYVGKSNVNRHAQYVVEMIDTKTPYSYLTNTKDLRAFDYYCDGCGKVRSGQPHVQHKVVLNNGYIDDCLAFCFLCSDERVNGNES